MDFEIKVLRPPYSNYYIDFNVYFKTFAHEAKIDEITEQTGYNLLTRYNERKNGEYDIYSYYFQKNNDMNYLYFYLNSKSLLNANIYIKSETEKEEKSFSIFIIIIIVIVVVLLVLLFLYLVISYICKKYFKGLNISRSDLRISMISSYSNYLNNDNFESPIKVSFKELIDDNYYLIDKKEEQLDLNLEIFHGITKSPLTDQNNCFIGLMLKSKFDSPIRQPIDFSVALDVSGSMSNTLEVHGSMSSVITLAKESLKKLISIMDDNDKMSLVTFDHNDNKIFGLLNKQEIQNKFLNHIDNLEAGGGTDLVLGLKSSMNNFDNQNNPKQKRIIMITDVEYEVNTNELLELFKQCVEEKGISITIIAINSRRNQDICDKISQFKGCNYFHIQNASDLEPFIIQNFNYIFFPMAYNIKITIESENVKIIQCTGEKNESESSTISINLNTFFLPKLLTINNNYYKKGGLILLKIENAYLNQYSDLKFNITLDYKSNYNNNNMEQSKSENYIIKKEDKCFLNDNLRKGASIYYFTILLNNMDQYNSNKKCLLVDYLNDNFIINPDIPETKVNFDNYKKILDNRYNKYRGNE